MVDLINLVVVVVLILVGAFGIAAGINAVLYGPWQRDCLDVGGEWNTDDRLPACYTSDGRRVWPWRDE